MKQNEVNSLKILQDRSKTNIFVRNCVEGKTKKNEASFFLNKAKKNEYNRSATIEDLPLLVPISSTSEAAPDELCDVEDSDPVSSTSEAAPG